MQLFNHRRVIKGMNRKQTVRSSHQTFMRVSVPTAHMDTHQALLKHALMNASQPERTNTNTQNLWRNFMAHKKIMVAGAACAVVALVLVSSSLLGSQSPKAYAEELTQQSLQAFDKLSPSQQQSLNLQIHSDATTDLQTAEHSSSLTVISYAQFNKDYAHISSGTVSGTVQAPGNGVNTPGPVTLNTQTLKYLRYTDSQGAIHVIGVNSNGLPVLELIFNSRTGVVTMGEQTTGQFGGAGSTTTSSSTTLTTGSGTLPPTGNRVPAGATLCKTSSNGATICTSTTANGKTIQSSGSVSGSAGTTQSGSGKVSCSTLTSGLVSCSQAGGVNVNTGNLGAGGGLDIKLGN